MSGDRPGRQRPHGSRSSISASLLAAGVMLTPLSARAETTGSDKLAFSMSRPPEGFDNLVRPQQTLLDVYYGGQRIGEVPVTYQPGAFRFDDVEALLSLLPTLADPATVKRSLADPHLDPHVTLACLPGQSAACGELSPEIAGVIFDQRRFRVDVFIAPEQLRVRPGVERRYLDTPPSQLTLVDNVGATVAGSDGSSATYTIQNRAVIGAGAMRLRSETTISSNIGLHVETLVAELDRPDLRYSAGLFWTPGIDLLGRRKIFGAGVGSQVDTRLDKYLLQGSPLILFLPRRARVDILRDGRLLASRTYEAGNQSLDTSALPSGSYDLALRIQEAGGGVREERRFFVKNAIVASMGQPLYFAYGGLLAEDSGERSIGITKTPYFQGGIGYRVSPHVATDASLISTGNKVMAEIGGYLFTEVGQFRAAALASSRGDVGVLLQANSLGRSALGYAFDLRKVWSRAGPTPIPLDAEQARSPASTTSNQFDLGESFTQINANITYRLGQARLGLSGFYRRDRQDRSYAIGPTAYWPVLRRHGLELAVDGHMTQSSQGCTGYMGLTLQLLRSHSSINGTVGLRSVNERTPGVETTNAVVAQIGGSWEHENVLGGEVSLSGALERATDEDSVRISANSRGAYGAAYLDAARTFSGPRQGTQYSAAFQTGIAITGDALSLGGKDVGEGSILVRIDGQAQGTVFEVLIDDSPQGQLRPGASVPLFLTPYRQYDVRIRPVSGDRASYDGRTRRVSIFPGTVAAIEWKAEPVVAAFGRAVWQDGSPVIHADVTAASGISQTDGQGYFQIEAGAAEVLNIRARDGRVCSLFIDTLKGAGGFAALGERRCQASSGTQYAQRSSP